jgi:hypothetical protein
MTEVVRNRSIKKVMIPLSMLLSLSTLAEFVSDAVLVTVGLVEKFNV